MTTRQTKEVSAGAFLAASMVLLVLTIVQTCSGCANTIDGARTALSAAERVQTAAIAEFGKVDVQHQADIIAAAKTKEEGEKALLAYRLKRAAIVKVVLDAAAVTAVGATLIPLVESGVRKSTDLSAWLVDLLAAGLKIKDALAQFTGGVP